MSFAQSRDVARAVALFAFAAVVLEVALVRMFTALLGQHFGAAWGVVVPLGTGLGALFGVMSATRPGAPFRAASVAHLTSLAAPCAAISVIFGVRAKNIDTFDVASLQQLALFLATSLLPFVFIGLVFAKVLGASQRYAPSFVRMALIASACALVAAPFVLRFGPARVGLGVAVAMSIAAVLFARASRFDAEGTRASSSLVATFVLGTSVVLAGEIGSPYLKIASLRWVGLDKADTQIWTSRGFYTVDKPHSNSELIRVDGTFGRSIPDSKQNPAPSADEMAYVLDKATDPVLVVGAGGGREIRLALRQGHHDVRAVEEDVTVARTLMRGATYAFSEELYDKPEVHVTLDGAKSYVRKAPATFQRIVLGYSDSQIAAPFGALAALPIHALTTEFVQDLLGALRPNGTLTIMRPDLEFDRLVALVAHALRARGTRAPGMNMFACTRDKLTTILVKRTPLDADELATLRNHCRRNRFSEVLSPDGVKEELRKALIAGVSADEVQEGQTSDLRPPTEDRPFWFYTMVPGRLPAALRDFRGMLEHHRTILVLAGGLALTAIVGVLALFIALFAPGRTWGYQSRVPVFRMSVALSSVVVAIVLFGNAFMGRVEPLVGRPDIVGLFLPLVFLLAIGLGAGFGGRFDIDDTRAGFQRWLLATTFVLAPLLMGLEGIFAFVVDLAVPLRILIPASILGLVGAGLGIGLGLGMRIAASWGSRTFACALAFAGIGAAFALLGGVFVAMNWGYSAALLIASASVVVAIVFATSARIENPLAASRFQPLSSDDTALDDEPISFSEPASTSTTVST